MQDVVLHKYIHQHRCLCQLNDALPNIAELPEHADLLSAAVGDKYTIQFLSAGRPAVAIR